MKSVKLRKIIILSVVAVAMIFSSLAFMLGQTAKADVSLTNYFYYENKTASADDMKINSDKAEIYMYDNVALNVTNKLTLDDFSMQFTFPANATSFKITITCDPVGVNGNKNANGGFDKTVENVLEFTGIADDNIDYVKFNSNASSADFAISNRTVKVQFSVNGSFLNAKVDGEDFTENRDYYKVRNINGVRANIKFVADLSTEKELMSFDYISQGSDEKYKQTFEVENGGLKKVADPVIYLPESFFLVGGGNVAELGEKYSLSISGTSFTGFSSSGYKYEGDHVRVDGTTIAFDTVGSQTLNVKKGDDVVKSYTIEVKDIHEDTTAPAYNMNTDAIEAFTAYYKDLLKVNDEGFGTVAIGSSEYLTLEKNKLKDMVSDDFTNFDNLTYTLYYKSETNSGDTTSLRIPLKEAGHYIFYIVFTDHAGNSIDTVNFYTEDVDNPDNVIEGVYKDYIFSFDVIDTSKLDISAPTPGTGYVGTKYNASNFTIESTSDHTDAYSLYYAESYDAENPDATEWKEIVKSSLANDEEKDYDGFTYDEIRAIGYDGGLSFTPNKVGFYKIEVNVTTLSAKDSDNIIIEVKEAVKTVKFDNHWVKNNVWSVVFLSVGTACLIAIVVLLFIKPKEEETDADEIE